LKWGICVHVLLGYMESDYSSSSAFDVDLLYLLSRQSDY